MKQLWLVGLPFFLAIITFSGIFAPNVFPKLKREKPVTILLYNHIVPELTPNARFGERYYYMLQEDFENQLKLLQDRDFTFLTYTQYLAIKAGTKQAPSQPLVLIFRDANTDIETYGLPILDMYNIPATVFYQPTSYGKPEFLTDEQVKRLEANNVDVVDANFTLLRDPTIRQEVSGVIRTAQFEDLLPTKQHNTFWGALAISTATFFLATFSLLAPKYSVALPLLFLPTYLIRFTFFGIPATFLELTVGIVVVANIATQRKKLMRAITQFPYVPQAILFLLAAVLSTIFAEDKMAALGGLKAFVIEPILYAFLVFYWLQKDSQEKNRASSNLSYLMLWSYSISAVFVSLIALKNFISGNAYINFQLEKLTTYFGNPNYLGSYLSFAIVVGFYVLLFSASWLKRGTALALLAVTLPTFYLSKSDTATIGIAAALGLLVLYRLTKRLHLPKWLPFVYTVLGIAAVSALFVIILNYRIFPALEKIGAATVLSRSFIYQASVQIIRESPVFGKGLLNYNREFIEHVDPLSPEQNVALAHNTILDFWAQMGVLGLLAFLWLLVRFFRITFLAPKDASREDQAIPVVLLGIMLTLIIHGMLDSQYHKNDYSLVFWLLIGLSSIFALPAVIQKKTVESRKSKVEL